MYPCEGRSKLLPDLAERLENARHIFGFSLDGQIETTEWVDDGLIGLKVSNHLFQLCGLPV